MYDRMYEYIVNVHWVNINGARFSLVDLYIDHATCFYCQSHDLVT